MKTVFFIIFISVKLCSAINFNRNVSERENILNEDARKHIGFVGLVNQGTTCYMNSIIQILFSTNQFRAAVYKIPTENDISSKSITFDLQRVFYELQTSNKPVDPKNFTKAFGWNLYEQRDAIEFLFMLRYEIEKKMEKSFVENIIPTLFYGKFFAYIKCKFVNCTTSRTESFFEVILRVEEMKNIYESLDGYVREETLEGDNKYYAEGFGLQEAKKGYRFQTLPPVLHFRIQRFVYDWGKNKQVKINSRFEFPEILDMNQYLSIPEKISGSNYSLHSVLIHSGDGNSGHYVAFINPKNNGKWFKFDDALVSECTKTEALDDNFGGLEETSRNAASAYMLVYIRQSELKNVLQDVIEDDIPKTLLNRFRPNKTTNVIQNEKLQASMEETKNFFSVSGNLDYIPRSTLYKEQSPKIHNDTVNYSTIKINKATISDKIAKENSKQQSLHVNSHAEKGRLKANYIYCIIVPALIGILGQCLKFHQNKALYYGCV